MLEAHLRNEKRKELNKQMFYIDNLSVQVKRGDVEKTDTKDYKILSFFLSFFDVTLERKD